MLLLLRLLFLAFQFSSHFVEIPTFYEQYICEGFIELPYSNIIEPFTVKYDESTKSSIFSYYHNTSFSLSSAKYGSMSIVPASFDGVQKMDCLSGGSFQSVFPDLRDFKKKTGTYSCRSRDSNYVESPGDCLIWELITSEFNRTNTYRFFTNIKWEPVRYEMFGYDSLFHSHYDEYSVQYTLYRQYEPELTDKNINDVLEKYCQSEMNRENRITVHLDLISEIFDQEKSEKVHKEHFDVSISSFDSQAEYQKARNDHRNLFRFVMAHNRRKMSYQLNPRAIQKWKTRKSLPCRQQTQGSEFMTENPDFGGFHDAALSESSLPNNFDWRTLGAVSPVKDQAICGSCWAFGTTGVFESHYYIMTNRSVQFSEQYLVDCSWSEGNNGCFGGLDVNSYSFVKMFSLASTEEYGPYMGQDMNCRKKEFTNFFTFDKFKVVPDNEKAIMSALYYQGPLSIAIDASLKTFGFYHDGVYDDPECSSYNLDHAVLLVGYGTSPEGKDYWLVKNSWSTHWGNQGYVKISRENNLCGVMSSATYPIFH